MKVPLILTVAILGFLHTRAQNDSLPARATELLEEVVVKGFENNRRLVDVPAAVSVVTKADLNRFSNISILPALNINPGIRMEERSPGSYRLNIRGSSLRSPFGVRNIKVYYNGIPYTDPGGNTFLSSLGFYNIQGIEIIKGPGSSLYGAGTGGVLLIDSDVSNWSPGITLNYSSGSYNTSNANVNLRFGSTEFQNNINYQDLRSDGYRDHTKLDRKVFSWDASAKVGNKSRLRAHVLYSDLYYQTPGALTAGEFALNPRAARPRTGPTPSSAEAQAAIYTKLYIAGVSMEHQFNDHWKNTTSLYGAFSELRNPTIRNYERRTEPHVGGRTTLEYSANAGNSTIRVQAGTEIQQGFSTVRVANNVNGQPNTIQNEDEIVNRQASVFFQAIAELSSGWTITAGASINQLKISFMRLTELPVRTINRTYENEFAPRVAILKKIRPNLSVYGSVSKGFSPPTTGELLPSTNIISTNLEAEEGLNYELGTRGSLLRNRLYFDVNAFIFRLDNTIVQRRDANGADYFENAGSTNQKGIESFLSYRIINTQAGLISDAKVWASHTWHHFRYRDYLKVAADTADFSGNRLPSVAPHIFSAGFDLQFSAGFYGNLTYLYTDPIPLNDANTFYASSFNLLSSRIGFRKSWNKIFTTDVYVSGDNLFDVQYSLGNDINAFGNRFYNAAPGRNYIVGASVRLSL